VINVASGVEATTDSILQIGSITKTFTGTLTMQLVDRRRLKLDEPVVSYLPDFMAADREVTKKVTIRHLLTHNSGIDGDFFVAAGRGEGRIREVVVRELEPMVDEISVDNMGNVIAHRRGKERADKLMLAATIERIHGADFSW